MISQNSDEKLDVRILTFKKNNRPYSKSKVKNVSTEKYISSHYIDYFEFIEVDITDNKASFMEMAYNDITRIREENEIKATSIQQSIILFQYSDMKGRRLHDFWQNVSSHMFITMLKILDCDNRHKLEATRQSIVEIMKKHNIPHKNYAIYYTFDFSDIILLVKNVSNSSYQDILWEINFSTSYDNNKLIMDSITLFGISFECYDTIKNCNDLKEIDLKDNRYENLKKNKITALVNLGVQDAQLLALAEKFCKNFLRQDEYSIDASFGRNDIMIILKDVELLLVTKFYGELKKLSDECNDISKAFLGIKIVSSVPESKYIKNVINSNNDITKLGEKTKENKFLNNFENNVYKAYEIYTNIQKNNNYMDATEMYRSIFELSRNLFSEEFVISIYYSFFVFLKICIEKKDNVEEIMDFQKDYISCINMLSHCTMHGEKCFIQSAPFNPLYIDVPPKILAFYTSIAFKIKKILQNNEQQLFSFIFIPGFRPNIHVKPISYGSDVDNRLIAVYIYEKMLYNPYRVVCSIVHEIAHYVGDRTRCRNERLHYIISTILKMYMYSHYLKDGVLDLVQPISVIIENKIKNKMVGLNVNECYSSIFYDYLYETNFLIKDINDAEIYSNDFEMTKGLDSYFDKSSPYYTYINNLINEDASSPYLYKKKIYQIIINEINKNFSDEWYDEYVNQCIQMIGSYVEAYADLVLCKVTGISFVQYIELLNEELQGTEYKVIAKKVSDDYIYGMVKNSQLNLELALRINAIYYTFDGHDDTICEQIDSNIQERKVYQMMLYNLVQYLKRCQVEIINITKNNCNVTELSDLVKNIKTLSKSETFYAMYEEIFHYKNSIIEEIEKIEGN